MDGVEIFFFFFFLTCFFLVKCKMNHMASSFYRKKWTIYLQELYIQKKKKKHFCSVFFPSSLIHRWNDCDAHIQSFKLLLVYISVSSISFRLDLSLCMNGVCARPSLCIYRNSSGKKWNTLFLFLCICRSIVWTYMSFCDCLWTYVCVGTQAVIFICPFQCMHVIQFL